MTEIERIRELSPEDMLMLGIKDVAYIKGLEVDGETAFGLFRRERQSAYGCRGP